MEEDDTHEETMEVIMRHVQVQADWGGPLPDGG